MTPRRLRVLVIAIVVASSPTACSRGQVDRTVANEQRTVIDWVTGAGASILSVGRGARSGMSMTAVGELSIPLAWPDYASRLRAMIVTGYRMTVSDASRVGFTRATNGDVYSFTIESLVPGPPTRARITFLAAPN